LLVSNEAKEITGASRWMLFYILLVGVLLTIALFSWVQSWERQQAQSRFENVAASYITAIRYEMRRHVEAVNSIASFHRSTEATNRAAFRAFVEAVLLEHGDIQALEWAPRVRLHERNRFETEAHQAGFSDFRITERNTEGELVVANEREEYFPVYYVEPYESNKRALGFDLASSQVRREALELARDSGKMIISERIVLVQDENEHYGYLMFKPIYNGALVPEGVAARRVALKGYALGVFRLGEFINEALRDSAHTTLNLWVYDQLTPGSQALLYFRGATGVTEGEHPADAGLQVTADELSWQTDFEWHGRKWGFLFKPSSAFLAMESAWRSWVILFAGLALTMMALLFFYREQRYTQMIERHAALLVQEKSETEQRYLQLFNCNSDALFVVNIDKASGPGKFLDVNDAMCQRLGYTRDELLQLSPVDINVSGMEEELKGCVQHVLAHKNHLFEAVHVAKDGREIPVEINLRMLDGNDSSLFIGCARDVTTRRRVHEEQIEAREWEMAKLSSALEQTADSIMITDRHGIIEYVNPAFVETTGYTRDEAYGRGPSIIKSGRTEDKVYEILWQTILRGEVYRNVLINRKKNGSLYYEEKTISPLKDSNGKITHFISSGKDITERMHTEERLHHLAYHDILTDLPNRVMFVERIINAIKQSRGSEHCAVLFIDLDRFKNINDTLGHEVGDQLLQAVPERLLSCVRDRDTVARFGGDEFALLLEKIPSSEAVAKVAAKLMEVLSKPYEIDSRQLYLTASIGISLSPDDSTDANTLIKNADTAMYRAKDTGRNNFQFYSIDMGVRAFERLSLETNLRYALERDEFELYYQPQIEMVSGNIVGCEALIRWQHPEFGLVTPDKFIPLLEDTGLIVDVGGWVVNTACKQGKEWVELSGKPLKMAVNLSGRQFRDESLIEMIREGIEAHSFTPSLLDIEITETVLMQDDRISLANIGALKALGVQLSIDDFGTGYSSLSYLKRFPVDTIKIDRAFTRDVTSDPEDAAIVNAVIAMAHSLKLEVIAEGVEHEDQVDFLTRYGCDYMQGDLFGKPLPQSEFRALIMNRT